MVRRWFRIALVNFFVAAGLGVLLRYAFVSELSWMHFRHVLHAHSHTALLGWVFLALFLLMARLFDLETASNRKGINTLLILAQISIVGMLVSFPSQGYGPVSIPFNILHVLSAWGLLFLLARKLWGNPQNSARFGLMAIGFFALSTLGVLGMGPMVMAGLQGTIWYYLLIQFYLHFQFNGWILFGLLALFFRKLELDGQEWPPSRIRNFTITLLVATFLTYALAVAWSNPAPAILWVNSLGVMVQLAALWFFIRLIRAEGVRRWYRSLTPPNRHLIMVAFVCILLKVLFQSAVILPFIAEVAYTIRNFVIGFIHLILLGTASHFLLGLAGELGLYEQRRKPGKWVLGLFSAGFILSEFLLFLQGTLFWGTLGFLPFYYETLFAVSVLMPLALLLLLANQHIKKIL